MKLVKIKIITGTVLALLLALCIVLREYVSVYFLDVLIMLASVFAAYEISSCMQKIQTGGAVKKILFAPPVFAAVTFILFLSLRFSGVWNYFLIVESALLAVLLIYTYFVSAKAGQSCRKNLVAAIYPVVPFVFFYLINHIADYNLDLTNKMGLFAVTLTFAIAAFADIAAMTVGMIFKGPKLCPSASPNKTISGAIGAVVFGTLASVLTFIIFNSFEIYKLAFANFGMKAWMFVLIGIFISLLTLVGDIFESALKRKFGVKDTGRLFPGHGGIMDRLDGVCFAAVGVFLCFLLMVA